MAKALEEAGSDSEKEQVLVEAGANEGPEPTLWKPSNKSASGQHLACEALKNHLSSGFLPTSYSQGMPGAYRHRPDNSKKKPASSDQEEDQQKKAKKQLQRGGMGGTTKSTGACCPLRGHS